MRQNKQEIPKAKKPRRELNWNITDFMKQYAGLIVAIIAIILVIGIYSVVNDGIVNNDRRITSLGVVDSAIFNEIENISTSISSIETDIGNLQYNMDSVLSRMTTAETNINNLISTTTNIPILQGNISKLQENISKLWTEIYTITGYHLESLVKTNLTLTYYGNQTNTSRYCHLDFGINETGLDINEIKFMISSSKVNITLLNYTAILQPQLYQYLNGTFNDNYMLYWFGNVTNCSATFNITWNTSEYNTSILGKVNTKITLMVNSYIIKSFEIWERTVV